MAETRHGGRLFWLDPERRGVLPLDRFHLSRRLLRTVLSDEFEVGVDLDFSRSDRRLRHRTARAERHLDQPANRAPVHRVAPHGLRALRRCRREGELVGGLYGVAIGGVFFGESMFSFVRDASKAALVHLVARLRLGGFQLLDTQFVTAHLAQFGAEEIPRQAYREHLTAGLAAPARWMPAPAPAALIAEFRILAGLSPT